MNKGIELTEKDLYCIARHIQVYAFKKDDEVIKKEDNPCCRCKYRYECYKNNVCIYHWTTFKKLSKITSLKMGPGLRI
ncbi:hypothetical protein KLL39_04170 [Clostridioides difficile]|nr:hypothetical protein [Clostridioides difficile]MDN9434620.1 hypothetical protein [Clostridioides difficile]